MTTIEDKIKLFSKIVYEKIEEEKQAEIAAFEQMRDELIIKEKIKLEEEKALFIKEITKKTKFKSNEIVAKEKIASATEILKLKEKLICEAESLVKKGLIGFAHSSEYKSYFLKELKETLLNVKEVNVVLYLLQNDFEAFEEEIKEIIKEELKENMEIRYILRDIIGGFILEEVSGEFRIDNSLLRKLQDNKEKIGIEVMEIIKK